MVPALPIPHARQLSSRDPPASEDEARQRTAESYDLIPWRRLCRMPMIDRAGPDTTKLAATLVREARSLLRRAEKLAAATEALEDPEASHAASEARHAADRLVHQLGVTQQREQRRTREALRREQ